MVTEARGYACFYCFLIINSIRYASLPCTRNTLVFALRTALTKPCLSCQKHSCCVIQSRTDWGLLPLAIPKQQDDQHQVCMRTGIRLCRTDESSFSQLVTRHTHTHTHTHTHLSRQFLAFQGIAEVSFLQASSPTKRTQATPPAPPPYYCYRKTPLLLLLLLLLTMGPDL